MFWYVRYVRVWVWMCTRARWRTSRSRRRLPATQRCSVSMPLPAFTPSSPSSAYVQFTAVILNDSDVHVISEYFLTSHNSVLLVSILHESLPQTQPWSTAFTCHVSQLCQGMRCIAVNVAGVVGSWWWIMLVKVVLKTAILFLRPLIVLCLLHFSFVRLIYCV